MIDCRRDDPTFRVRYRCLCKQMFVTRLFPTICFVNQQRAWYEACLQYFTEYPNIQPNEVPILPSIWLPVWLLDITAIFKPVFKVLTWTDSSLWLSVSLPNISTDQLATKTERPSSALDSRRRSLDIVQKPGGGFCVWNLLPAPAQLAAGADLKFKYWECISRKWYATLVVQPS